MFCLILMHILENLLMYWIIALMIYLLLAIGMVVSLLVNGIKPAKTLAWLLTIFTIPVAGILLYWMLGRNRRKYSWKDLHEDKAIKDYLKRIRQNQNNQKSLIENFEDYNKLTLLIEKPLV